MASMAWSLERLVYSCLVAFTCAVVGDASAAIKKEKEAASVIFAAKPTPQHSEQRQPLLVKRAKKSSIPPTTKRHPEAIQKQAKPLLTERKQRSSKGYRRMKVHKKSTPKAVVQSRTDLMHYGMLESSQRYDPRRNHLGPGVPDPYNPELTHDHFQELDRNKDGKIDPVERTFGRLHMERDLSTYQRQR
jgi:hypothetical protein